jgi:hypothetical protein
MQYNLIYKRGDFSFKKKNPQHQCVTHQSRMLSNSRTARSTIHYIEPQMP